MTTDKQQAVPLSMKPPPVFSGEKLRHFSWAPLMALALFLSLPAQAAGNAPDAPLMAGWVWPLALFAVCFLLGIIAVPAGVGGGVLFVPIVGSFFPFHLDFVRGAGLLVALASSLAAGPTLLRNGLANLRLALPMALLASTSSIAGALLSLALPTAAIQTALGITILAIVALMTMTKTSDSTASVSGGDMLSTALRLHGVFYDAASGRESCWHARHTFQGLLLFIGIGFLAGLFGMGAGWANVPVLHMVMGVPLRISAGTSSFILSLVDSSAAWVYLNRGAVLAIIAVPSVTGMMLGARIGARLLTTLRASAIRQLVLGLLFFAGMRSLLKGLAIWS